MGGGGYSTASSYHDHGEGVEIQPVEVKSIPWSNSGPKKLTVKLALWWIHMLSGAGCDVDIGHDYPPLHSWTLHNARLLLRIEMRAFLLSRVRYHLFPAD
ncbi:hypothetical protein I7I51_01428 [Histoplasma capsulatum]|uniref:Uncharacterized protein n=1 Tax=Ajellomyces capsulatus TaxID=5037 RepID=A0A8A1MEL3_AJECA|nr:hypothetical protein I7I51_01428 [Histoplasma capsulatum]